MHLRQLTRPPALAVAGTLAISVCALTTAFGVAWAAILRPPPFRDAGRLTMLYSTHTDGAAPYNARWSYPRITLLKGRATSFSQIANYTGTQVSLTGGDETESVQGEIASSEYFTLLGVGARLGRTILPGDDEPSEPAEVVVLGHDLWQRRFGADPAVIGRTLGVNGTPLTIVGVLPGGFRGLTDRAQLWFPPALAPRLTYAGYLTTDQNFISAVARLRPESSIDVANTELQILVPRIFAERPDAEPEAADRPSGIARTLNAARVHPGVRSAQLLLLGTVALLHLLACANVTSLLLGSALARGRESAVRTALGCSPRALFVSRLAEGALVAAVGGVAGTLLAAWTASVVTVPADVWGPRNFYGALAAFSAPSFSWATIAFGLVLTVVTAALVALLPALTALRLNVTTGLRDGPRGTSARGTSLRRPSARGVIIAGETALAIVLLVAGGLMVESFNRMRHTELGVDGDGVLTFLIQPPDARIPPAAAPAYIDRMLAAITSLPGVTDATVDGGAPVSGTARSTLFIAGRETVPAAAPGVLRHYVAPGHFSTLGIPVVRGRSFTRRDVAGQPRVAIISETASRRFWPGQDPLGQRVWFGGPAQRDSSAEIVGIVGDVMYEPLDSDPNRSSFYTPYAQFTYSWRQYFVRTSGDPSALVAPIRRAVRLVDPNVPLTEVQTLRSLIGASWTRQRFDAFFYGMFALLALGLAVSGIYAVVSYAVGQRTREMGIRLALGARPGGVVRLVVREGLTFPAIGVVAGLGLAWAASGVLRASLYGVGASDPRVIGGAVGLLLLAALGACLVPARRATRVDPCESMRTD